MAQPSTSPALLSLPPELRNQIYDLVFTTPSPYAPLVPAERPSPRVRKSSLSGFGCPSPLDQPLSPSGPPCSCALLLTCRQLHAETQLLYYARTRFALSGPCAAPATFARLLAPLSRPQRRHLRHLSLTARISHLRALNEQWCAGPAFDCPDLALATLTIVPRRAHAVEPHYAEVADLNMSHTLAYILAETLKTLRGVRRLVVRNDDGCFNPDVWRLVYRSLVYRLWKWGGSLCGLSFRHDRSEREAWFEVLIGGKDGLENEDGDAADGGEWRDSWDEVERLVGADHQGGAAVQGLS
ncbi:hypothetical protein MBLNU459_g5084t1 [Dothideomycetes sp. NU459]